MSVRRHFLVASTLSLGLLFCAGIAAAAPLVGGNTYPINGVQNPPTSFGTIANAVTFLTSQGVTGSGQVVLQLVSGYPGDTAPIVIAPVPGVSASLGVTFRPGSGFIALTTISATSTDHYAIKIQSSYVTLDGRQGGVGSTPAWTIRSTGAASPTQSGPAVWISASGTISGIAVRWCTLETQASTPRPDVMRVEIGGIVGDALNGCTVEQNLIHGTGGNAAYGININSVGSALTVQNNTIDAVSQGGIFDNGHHDPLLIAGNRITSTTADVSSLDYYGIGFFSNMSPGARIEKNLIYVSGITGSTGAVRGIYVGSAGQSGLPLRISNNRVVLNPSSATTATLWGISDFPNADGALVEIDYNSVYVGGQLASGTRNSAAFHRVDYDASKVRNNIFFNARSNTGSATGVHWAIAINDPASESGSTMGHNDYFVSGAGGILGTTTLTSAGNKTTLAAWQAAVPGDAGSLSANPNYQNPTGSPPDLSLNPSSPTLLESHGIAIAGLDTDYQGDIRFGSVGYSGTGTAPEIGSDEGEFLLLQGNDMGAVAFVIPLAGEIRGTGRAFTPQATFQNAGTNSQTNVPVRFRIAGPSPSPNIVYEQTTTIASAPSGGPPIAVSFPTTSLSLAGNYTMTIRAELVGDTYAPNDQLTGALTIIDPLAGAYTVGAAQSPPFNTLTGAVNRLNAVGVSAAVTFNLSDASYSGAESLPIVISAFDGASASNTVTIKPASAVTAALSGSSSTAILVLNGADYVRLQGSNNGGSSRDWTISNTSSAANTAVVWLQTTLGSDPVTNNVVSNLAVVGAGSSLTLVGIGSGSNTIGLNSSGLGNNNNSVQNCKVTRTQVGIYSAGSFPKNTGTVVQGNTLGAAGIDAVRNCGILLRFEDGASVTGNSIDQVGGSALSAIGISLSFIPSTIFPDPMFGMNEVVHTLVAANVINAVVTSGTPSPPAVGIAAFGGSVGGNRIVNNVVRGVISPAPSAGNITAGIYVMPDVGPSEVFFNSVAMTGARGSTTTPSLALALDGGLPFVDARNNILYNTQTSTGTGRSYAIGLAGSLYGSLTSDRNVMFTSGTSARFAVVGGFSNTPAGDKTSLALWQSATGKDPNSVSADPRFVNPASDLHIQNTGLIVSPAALLAVPITGVTTDFDGDTRPALPDAGADEFITYEMNATVVGPGSVAKNPNQPTYNPGVTVQLTATAAPDGQFLNWSGDASGSVNPLSVIMNATKNIQANFLQHGLFVRDTSVIEGTGSFGYATFRVGTDFAPSQQVSVTLRTFAGTAHYGYNSDYDSTNVVLIFQAGVIDSQTVSVPIIADHNFEPDETFRLVIVNAQGFGVADSSGTCTITNDDGPPAIYCFDTGGPEGNSGTTLRSIQINLTAMSYLPIQFKARTVDGTATVANNDYQAVSPPQTFTIPPESFGTNIFLNVVGDTQIEPAEYFDVILSNPMNASIQDSTGRVTIQDDDTPTLVNVLDGQSVEGAAASISLEIEVTGPLPQTPLTLQYQTFGGTATAGVDYTPVSPPQTIELQAGKGFAIIPLLDDGDAEGAETVQVRILNPSSGMALGDSIGVATILDDDETVPPTVTLLTPNGGESWPVGTQQSVTWNASDNVGVQYVRLDLSLDGGTTWFVVDQILAQPAVYSWLVPNDPTGAAMMRIAAFDWAGNSTEDVSNATFRIPSVVGVAEAPAVFQMHPAAPNPFLGATLVSYSLDRDGPVRVEIFDVMGRRRAVLVDQPETKGPHNVRWDGRDTRGEAVPSGLYVIRLTFPGHVARERVLRIR